MCRFLIYLLLASVLTLAASQSQKNITEEAKDAWDWNEIDDSDADIGFDGLDIYDETEDGETFDEDFETPVIEHTGSLLLSGYANKRKCPSANALCRKICHQLGWTRGGKYVRRLNCLCHCPTAANPAKTCPVSTPLPLSQA